MHKNSSYPFLSVDFFIEISDVRFVSHSIEVNITKEYPIFFLRSELLPHCIDMFLNYRKPYTLITGANDDMCIPYFFYPSKSTENIDRLLNDPYLLKWYSKNICIQHPKLVALPIGPRFQWRSTQFFGEDKSAILKLYKSLCLNPADSIKDITLKSNLLYINMRIDATEAPSYKAHANIRLRAMEHFSKLNFAASENKSVDKYLAELRSHKFCVSPPGRGIDAHRTWEALMVGTIPICISSSLDEIYEKLPVVVVDDYSVITKEYLENIYPTIIAKEYDFSILYCDYWKERIIREARPQTTI